MVRHTAIKQPVQFLVVEVTTLIRLVDVAVLSTAIIAVIQFLQLGSSLAFELRISLYSFAAAIPIAAMQLILLTLEEISYATESLLSLSIHPYVASLCLLLGYQGLSGIFAYFSYRARNLFMFCAWLALLLISIDLWYRYQASIRELLMFLVGVSLVALSTWMLFRLLRDSD